MCDVKNVLHLFCVECINRKDLKEAAPRPLLYKANKKHHEPYMTKPFHILTFIKIYICIYCINSNPFIRHNETTFIFFFQFFLCFFFYRFFFFFKLYGATKLKPTSTDTEPQRCVCVLFLKAQTCKRNKNKTLQCSLIGGLKNIH